MIHETGPLDLPLTAERISEVIEEAFPGTDNLCHEIGPDYAIAMKRIDDSMLRPGGFVSGPTQFSIADAALWYMTFAAIGRIEPMSMTSELSIRFLRPARGELLWARADVQGAGRRNVVGSVSIWCDDRVSKPTAVAQGTYALPI